VATTIAGDSMRALGVTDYEVIAQANAGLRGSAPVPAAQAAAGNLGGARSGQWRVLGGDGARKLDELVRATRRPPMTTRSWPGTATCPPGGGRRSMRDYLGEFSIRGNFLRL
jgi:hypothetical protein